MSKHSNSDVGVGASAAKKKRSELTGWSKDTFDKRWSEMGKRKLAGTSWRRAKTIRIAYKTASIKWSQQSTSKLFTITTPVQVGMTALFEKLQSAQNRSFQALPNSIKTYFSLATKEDYSKDDFRVHVSFSEEKYDSFRYLYCNHCNTKKFLSDRFWKCHSSKLPDEVDVIHLMRHWDQLGESWNSIDVLGCLLPNDENDTVVINARRFLLRPEQHWNSVHADLTSKPQKSSIATSMTSFFKKEVSSSSLSNSTETCSTTSSSVSTSTITSATQKVRPSVSDKTHHHHTQLKVRCVDEMLDPNIDFKHKPVNQIEEFAIGQVFKSINVGVNKMISNNAVIDNYKASLSCCKELYDLIKSSQVPGTIKLPPPRTVRLNMHNINQGYEALLQTYRKFNMDSNNPYRKLEKSEYYGVIHDATSHWVKQLNTVFIRAVDDDGSIVKVPFSMKQVAGSLTGEVLCEEIMKEVSSVKVLKQNATSKIEHALRTEQHGDMEALHSELKKAADELDLTKISEIQEKIKEIQEQGNQQEQISDMIIPIPPHYFKMAKLQGVDHDNKCIHLEIPPQYYPTSICGDGCSVNLKATRLVGEKYGLMSPLSSCYSHMSSGTIRRTATSQTMSDENVTALYNNLKPVLKHFSMSPKSTELLNNALDALDRHNVHMLVWGGTRMAGFLDACKQASGILTPFLDTLVVGNIRKEEAAYLLSAKGIYTLELLADLHPVFADKFLHHVDSDVILSCEAFQVAEETALKLQDNALSTPKADAVVEGLSTDQFNNVIAKFILADGNVHTHILNEKISRNKTLRSIKDGLINLKKGVLNCLVDNIKDQNKEGSICHLMSAFNLASRDGLESRVEKVKLLHKIYGTDQVKKVGEKWFDFDVSVTYKKKLNCLENDLIEQFNLGYEKIVSLAREYKEAKAEGKLISQHSLWKRFLVDMGMQCPDVSKLVLIMISVATNSGWVERAYSFLDQVCNKKRNRMNIENLKEIFFLALLKLELKDCLNYTKEIEVLGTITS